MTVQVVDSFLYKDAIKPVQSIFRINQKPSNSWSLKVGIVSGKKLSLLFLNNLLCSNSSATRFDFSVTKVNKGSIKIRFPNLLLELICLWPSYFTFEPRSCKMVDILNSLRRFQLNFSYTMTTAHIFIYFLLFILLRLVL